MQWTLTEFFGVAGGSTVHTSENCSTVDSWSVTHALRKRALLSAAGMWILCWSVIAQAALSHQHSSAGIESIATLDSGGLPVTFGLFDLTVSNASGLDWDSYTLYLPDVLTGAQGNFGGATLTEGAFTSLSISPDLRYVGVWGGVVSNGGAFLLTLGINYELQQELVGEPSIAPSTAPPSIPPYEPPVGLGNAPPPPQPEWFDPSQAVIPGPVANDWWTIVSMTAVGPNGELLDRIVGYNNKGEYSVVENGVLVGSGTADPSKLNDFAHDYTSGQTNQTTIPLRWASR